MRRIVPNASGLRNAITHHRHPGLGNGEHRRTVSDCFRRLFRVAMCRAPCFVDTHEVDRVATRKVRGRSIGVEHAAMALRPVRLVDGDPRSRSKWRPQPWRLRLIDRPDRFDITFRYHCPVSGASEPMPEYSRLLA